MNTVMVDEDEDEVRESKYVWRLVIRARIMRTKLIARLMETEHLNSLLLGLTEVKTPEDYYGFAARDVACLHEYQHGIGRGLFFRLYDGRVIDAGAKPQNPDRLLYDTTIH